MSRKSQPKQSSQEKVASNSSKSEAPIPLKETPEDTPEEAGAKYSEAWGALDKKYLCLGCENPKVMPIFYIGEQKDSIEGRICFICLDICRYKHHIKVDDLHKKTSKEVKKLLAEKVIDEDKPSTVKDLPREVPLKEATETSEGTT